MLACMNIAVSGCQMEFMTVDGVPLETDESNLAIVSNPLHPVTERTHLVLNPTKAIGDTPVSPRLCEVGFATDAETGAAFRDFRIHHYGGEQNEIFGEQTGAGYSVFDGKQGDNPQSPNHTKILPADYRKNSHPLLVHQSPVIQKINEAYLFLLTRTHK